jgi:DNA (cytosine-5)-methyltransferase 1
MDVVSFFAGCGGLDLGFEEAGFRVIWANEFDPHCRATYIRNHPNTKFVLEDICSIHPDTIPDCDGFIGGPPCQSWSVGGNQKGLDDARGQLFVKYIELIRTKKPKFFVIENVKGMLDDKFKNVFDFLLNSLTDAGYNVQWTLLDAVKFRVPQNRERVFFVGFRKDINVSFSFPISTCDTPITLEQAIGDIKVRPTFFSTDMIKKLNDSEIADNQFPNHDVFASNLGSFYYRGNRRRGWKQPSFTINATADYAPLHPSSPKMIYNGYEDWKFQMEKIDKYRRMSVRECARIQTFPDSFVFEYENIKDAYKMIGNAVPPRLGREIAKSIYNAFEGVEQSCVVNPEKQTNIKDEIVLVGYCKGEEHKRLILKNLLYYVRSDGRKGSIFKDDCAIMPKYLLLHHKNDKEIYELDAEEPVLVDASLLKTLGFVTSGSKYLCFRLKSAEPRKLPSVVDSSTELYIDAYNFAPYFTTINEMFAANFN